MIKLRSGLEIKPNVKLAPYTNYKIGGPAQYFCAVSLPDSLPREANRYYQDVIGALDWAKRKGLPIFVLGGGTNLLVSDKGYKGLVLKIESQSLGIKNISKKLQNKGFQHIRVGAGVLLNNLVNFSLQNGLMGLEWAAGIPGTIGGAIRGNAGAFGHSMADVIETVNVLTMEDITHNMKHITWNTEQGTWNIEHKTRDKKEIQRRSEGKAEHDYKMTLLNKRQLKFKYRSSIIKEKGGIIVGATFKLKRAKSEEEKAKNGDLANSYISYRKTCQPLCYPSCGSVFKNLEINKIQDPEKIKKIKKLGVIKKGKIGAGKLIAASGLAGKKVGNAQISEKHANFIVNLGDAKAQDIYKLIKLCQREVFKKFGIKLEREVELVGFED